VIKWFTSQYGTTYDTQEDMMSPFVQYALKLMNTELDRIEESMNRLSDIQIWTRLREGTNSIGNLCLHLAGNEYQTIISGIGGKPFIRERSSEFELNGGIPGKELIHYLRNIRKQSEDILNELHDDDLQKEVRIVYSEQDWKRMKQRNHTEGDDYTHTFPSIHALLFHVTEHYGYHTGQIVFITKILQEGTVNITEFRH
jgi:uncharacterized damage-inducible protein DinB